MIENPDLQIIMKFCTCHNSSILSHEKFSSNYFIKNLWEADVIYTEFELRLKKKIVSKMGSRSFSLARINGQGSSAVSICSDIADRKDIETFFTFRVLSYLSPVEELWMVEVSSIE